MKKFFWNQQQNRLRAFWRILIVISSYFGLLYLLRQLFMGAGGNLADTSRISITFVHLGILLLILAWVAWRIDKRDFAEYGLNLWRRDWWINFGFGVLLGGVMITAVFLLEFFIGWVHIIDTFANSTDIPFVLAITPPIFFVLADITLVYVVFFGFLLINLAESFRFLETRWVTAMEGRSLNSGRFQFAAPKLQALGQRLPVLAAWAFATLFFLSSRLGDGDATKILLYNLIRGSLLLALPFVLTRNLGLTIGIGLGWNIISKYVLGFSTRTIFLDDSTSVLLLKQEGPAFFTGGVLGPEAGILAMGALVLGGIIMLAWIRYRHKKHPPAFNPWIFEYHPNQRSDGS
ncbi:MAG: hypothetical protein KDE48_04450 [Anaerolineales bacterium]|nr:hypothetical protein [Anaerolineales bacterium]